MESGVHSRLHGKTAACLAVPTEWRPFVLTVPAETLRSMCRLDLRNEVSMSECMTKLYTVSFWLCWHTMKKPCVSYLLLVV